MRTIATAHDTGTNIGSHLPHPTADMPERIRDLVVQSLEDDKAEDTVVIDLQGKTSLADFMVVTTGRSARQVGSMADHLLEKLKALGIAGVGVEGAPQCDWVLIDAGDVIVHLFRPEVRAFYNIEKMWGVEPPVSLLNVGLSDYLPV